jgi:UDP-3-O-[3-hydroxymyristoyl] glucosamine N-acyltransferase
VPGVWSVDRPALPDTLHVADKTFVGAQCGVISNTKGNEQLIGSPAMEPKAFFKSMAVLKRLPDMYHELNALRKELDELKSK